MRLAVNSIKSGDSDAVVSAGNTGALMAISKVILILCKSCHTSYDTNRNNLTALDRVVNSNIKTNNRPQPRK